MNTHVQQVIGKLERLPPERLAEVENFIDFLSQQADSNRLRKEYSHASEQAFSKVWDNAEDAIYDDL